MNERELLEYAAKACGFKIVGYGEWRNGIEWAELECGTFWNAKEDDGDCARMEAELGLDITWYKEWVSAISKHAAGYADYKDYPDKQAARRMASLRVAAEIGKSMP